MLCVGSVYIRLKQHWLVEKGLAYSFYMDTFAGANPSEAVTAQTAVRKKRGKRNVG